MPPPRPVPKRYHGTAELYPTHIGRDAGQIAEEVVSHLAGLLGAKVTVTLEIAVDVAGDVPENVVRIVNENSRTLRFTMSGFEEQ